MNSPLYPIIGNWYRIENQQIFEVVALDEAENLIEIQFFEGDIDELDFDTWNSSEVENVAPPEDWSGAFDDMDGDEFGYSDVGSNPRANTMSLEDFD